MANREITKLTRDVSRLKFSNPGRFMENFDPERSRREMRKVHRRFYRESHRASRVYSNDGLRLSDGADVCDCLDVGCPGCHLPCPRCFSPKCGTECRNNRTWFYTEVEMEGSRTKMINDVLLKHHSNSVTSGKSHSQQQQQQQQQR